MKDCTDCEAFIAWLRELAVTDEDAARLLAKLDELNQMHFCRQHAHWDRRQYRAFRGLHRTEGK